MLVNDIVKYKRTAEMEELYIMLVNDATAYRLWHSKAVNYAKAMHNGTAILMEQIASKMMPCITQSCVRLLNEYHKITGDFLNVTKEQIEIVSWQWFYNEIMESYNFIK